MRQRSNQHEQQRQFQPLGLMAFSILSGVSIQLAALPAWGQIVPDATLGNETSIVSPDRPVRGLPATLIEGGAIRGSNLFQSFREFNVGEGQRVYFANPAGVDSILSRVTGANASRIFGLLGVNGAANLFLMNPNGIVFGANARLDIAGSFVATTADRLTFDNGATFSARNPEPAPLLTIALRPNLPYGTNYQGNISHAGNLAVGMGQTLSLQGQTVTSQGSLTAPGGTVQVLGDRLALLDGTRIDVSNEGGGGTVLIGGELQGRGNVPNATDTLITPGVTINADAIAAGDGGRVIIWADNDTQFAGQISARGGATAGNGGFVEVSGKQTLTYNGAVDTTAPNGRTGTLLLDPFDFEINASNVDNINRATTNLQLQADNNISFNAPINITNTGIGFTATAGNNIFVNRDIVTNSGDVKLVAGNGLFVNGVEINTNPSEAVGTIAGTLELQGDKQVSIKNSSLFSRSDSDRRAFSAIGIVSRTGSVQLENVFMSTTNFGSGFAGDIVITAAEEVRIAGNTQIFSRGNQGFVYLGRSTYQGYDFAPQRVVLDDSLVEVTNGIPAPGVINAGSVFVSAQNEIRLDNGSLITSSTRREGNAGNVILVAPEGLVSIANGSAITSDAGNTAIGNAGGVGILAENLQVTGRSRISTSTFTNASAFNPSSASGRPTTIDGSFAGAVVLFIGNSALLDDSNIFNNLENGASGQAGVVLLTARSLSLLNGAQIQTIVRGQTNQGPAANGNAGNILIGVDDTIRIVGRNSRGFASAIFSSVEAGATGNSGNVIIAGRNRPATTSIQVREGGTINVRNLSRRAGDEAGIVAISSRAVWLDQNASIIAVSESGQGGNILLDLDALILGRNSFVSATAGISGTGGSGGNIAIGRGNLQTATVLRQDGLLVAAPAFTDRTLLIAGKTPRDNNILAQAFRGTGGNIRINAFRLQDIADRPDLTTRNDISTSSFLGNSGTTVVNALNIFPAFRVDPLPDRNETPQIAQGCDPRVRQESSQFTITGRGGLPPNAADGLNLATFATPTTTTAAQSPDGQPPDQPPVAQLPPIAPARGWTRNPDGTIQLVAQVTDPARAIAPTPLWYSPPCYAP